MPSKKKQTLDQEMQEAHDSMHKEREDAEFEQAQGLTEQERLEAMRLYVQSMEKVQGHSNEAVRGIIHSIHKRFILLLNYSGIDDKLVKPLKVELDKLVKEEQERYKDE
jgi:hypothetical protein